MPDSSTSLTLLDLLRAESGKQLAWNRFVERYQPKIQQWCRQWGAQSADADDVAQIVLTKLTDRLRTFRYDRQRSFRAYLRKMTQHVWNDLMALHHKGGLAGESHFGHLIENLEARKDLERRLAEEFDQELLAEALRRVQHRVALQTWDAFRLTALEGKSGAEAARSLSMPVAHVFVAKHRVQKMLKLVVNSMDSD